MNGLLLRWALGPLLAAHLYAALYRRDWIGEWNWTVDTAIGSATLGAPVLAACGSPGRPPTASFPAAGRGRAAVPCGRPSSRPRGLAHRLRRVRRATPRRPCCSPRPALHGGPFTVAALLLAPAVLAVASSLGVLAGYCLPSWATVAVAAPVYFAVGTLVPAWLAGVFRQGPVTGTLAGLAYAETTALATVAAAVSISALCVVRWPCGTRGCAWSRRSAAWRRSSSAWGCRPRARRIGSSPGTNARRSVTAAPAWSSALRPRTPCACGRWRRPLLTPSLRCAPKGSPYRDGSTRSSPMPVPLAGRGMLVDISGRLVAVPPGPHSRRRALSGWIWSRPPPTAVFEAQQLMVGRPRSSPTATLRRPAIPSPHGCRSLRSVRAPRLALRRVRQAQVVPARRRHAAATHAARPIAFGLEGVVRRAPRQSSGRRCSTTLTTGTVRVRGPSVWRASWRRRHFRCGGCSRPRLPSSRATMCARPTSRAATLGDAGCCWRGRAGPC